MQLSFSNTGCAADRARCPSVPRQHFGALSLSDPLAGYSFPMAITRCHNLGGLKQWEHVLSRFWSLEAQSQVTSRPHGSAGSRGRSSWHLLTSRGCRQSLARGCITPLAASVFAWPSLCALPSHGLPSSCVCADSPLLTRTPVTG